MVLRMFLSQVSKNNSFFTLYLIRTFLLCSGLIITVYAVLGLFLYLSPNPILPFFPLIYSLWRELFYNFFGLFWIQLRFFLYIDYVSFSLLLLIVGSIQVGVSFLSNNKSSYFFYLILAFLLINLTFLPLGIFSLYLLYNFFSIDRSQFQNISLQHSLFNNSFENKSALLLLGLLVLDFVVVFAFLGIIRAIYTTDGASLDPILTLTIFFCTISVLGSSCAIGLVYFNKRLFLVGSILTGLLSFLVFNIIVLSFYNLYPTIHGNIVLLAPLSMFIIGNALLDGYLLITFKKINFEVFSFEN